MQQPSQENADGVNNQTGNQLEDRNYNKKNCSEVKFKFNYLKIPEVFWQGEVLLFFTLSRCIYKLAELFNLEPKLILETPKMLLHLIFRCCSTNCTFPIDPGRFTLQHQHC